MTGKQENVRSMTKAVQAMLQANMSIVNLAPGHVQAKLALDNIVARIDGQEQVQMRNWKGTTEDKDIAQDEAIACALVLKAGIQAYADTINNRDLWASVNYSTTAMKKGRDTSLPSILNTIRDAAQSVVSNLEDFGITSTNINDLTAKAEAYEQLEVAPRTGITITSNATGELRKAFLEQTKILKRLDALANVKALTHAEFVGLYLKARIIVDSRGGGKGGVKQDDGAEDDGAEDAPKDGGTKQG